MTKWRDLTHYQQEGECQLDRRLRLTPDRLSEIIETFTKNTRERYCMLSFASDLAASFASLIDSSDRPLVFWTFFLRSVLEV